MAKLTNQEITAVVIEEGYNMTDNINEAIYLLSDGSMISGDFDYGSRGTDHRMIEILMESDRYDDNFWNDVHTQLEVVRLVPESNMALIIEGQELSTAQEALLINTEYEIEVY
jgi:hypothetical protein